MASGPTLTCATSSSSKSSTIPASFQSCSKALSTRAAFPCSAGASTLIKRAEPAVVDLLVARLAVGENAIRFRTRHNAGAAHLAVHRPQALTHRMELIAGEAVERRQSEERHLRADVVLGMERHVPAQCAHQRARLGRARVGAHVRPLVAALVLGDAP